MSIKNPFTLFRILFVFCCLLMSSCNQGPGKKDKTPSALQDKSIDVSTFSKRSGNDLLENLYDELTEKSKELRDLDKEIELLQKMKGDSAGYFSRYNGKSRTYYDAAFLHIKSIKDSLLRNKMKLMVDSSIIAYDSSINRHKQLLAAIDSSQLVLNDMYAILMLMKTLPVIEKYQRDNLPADTSLQKILDAYGNTTRKTDSLARK
jgi:hypothetical protein